MTVGPTLSRCMVIGALFFVACCAFGCSRSEATKHERLVVDGVLQVTSPAPYAGPYVRALVLYTYRITNVVEGVYSNETIQVYHWAILDRKLRQETTARKKGQSYRLVLERFDDYPKLAQEDRTETQLDFDLPLFMDTSLGVDPKPAVVQRKGR